MKNFPNLVILSDEVYDRLIFDKKEIPTFLNYPYLYDRLIVLNGWSKTYAMTGWRLGYALWPDSLVDAATRLAINCHSCVNAGTQFAGIAALEGPQDSVYEMVRAFDERRHVIVERLNAIKGFNCRTPMGAFYAFPSIAGTGQSAREVQDRLLNEAHVATVAGTSFGHLGEDYLRFSYANSVQNIEDALERVACLYN